MMEGVWLPQARYRGYSPLRETPREYFECLEDCGDCQDELFLLPERALDMDSYTLREDLSSIVPSYRRSPHNSLDSSDSGKSVKLAEDSDGFLLARASDHCKTFWLSETSNMTGVGEQSPSLSQDMPAMMTQSMCIPSGSPMSAAPDIMTSSTSSLQGLRKSSGLRSRAESAAREKEREERVRRIRDAQEEERRRKLEELKQHAQQAQKFREQQEEIRRRHIDELRSKDMDRRAQVEERRRDIEKSEQERREAILARNKERESRLETQRRSSRGNIEFAFGSSAPRLVEPRVDSASGYWGSRSGQPQSQEREPTDLRSKRTASAQGLDRSNEGDENGLTSVGTPNTAHRRRTDLVPTLTMRREDNPSSGAATPRRSPGRAVSMSRLEQLARPQERQQLLRPQHVGGAGVQGARSMQHLAPPSLGQTGGLRGRELLTNGGGRARARTLGATPKTEKKGTPKPDRLKRARSVTSDNGGLDDDNRSTASSQSVGPSRTPNRRTPSQVKAEAAARKAKTPATPAATRSQTSTPKSSLGGRKEAVEKKEEAKSRKTPSPAVSQDLGEGAGGGDVNGRQSTPDIIRDNNTKRPQPEQEKSQEAEKEAAEEKEESPGKEASPVPVSKEATPEVAPASKEGSQEVEEVPNNEEVREKKIITSEEEAKARIAEKRREMKEQKEREAEAERLRLEEERRLEEEQRRKEEEERIQKAIQEREEEERRQKDEEEKLRKEKEETEKKMKEEAEKREAELQEKLKKEEEERLARKKRIEEIMARTRGGKGKGDAPTPVKKEEERSESTPPQQPPSLDPMGDPTKPDLIGDISDKVEAENARNLSQSGPSPPSPAEPEVEKGALDSLSLKSEDTENSSPIITIENGVPSKKSNGCVDGSSFDQILDLGDMADSNKEKAPGVPSPIRAFEENSQHNNAGALGARDLLS